MPNPHNPSTQGHTGRKQTRLGSSRTELAVILVAALFPTLSTVLYFNLLSGHPSMGPVYGLTKVIQFSLPVVWVLWILREPLAATWPNVPRSLWRSLLWGTGFGMVIAALTVALYFGLLRGSTLLEHAPAVIREKLIGVGANTPAKFLFVGLFLSVLHSALEEYYWRWFVFGRMQRVLPVVWAIALSSLGFMSHHVLVLAAFLPGQPLGVALFSSCIAIGGAFWAWLYLKTGSLWGPWISHLLVDAGIMLVGYELAWGLSAAAG